jgi:hypothetical protein
MLTSDKSQCFVVIHFNGIVLPENLLQPDILKNAQMKIGNDLTSLHDTIVKCKKDPTGLMSWSRDGISPTSTSPAKLRNPFELLPRIYSLGIDKFNEDMQGIPCDFIDAYIYKQILNRKLYWPHTKADEPLLQLMENKVDVVYNQLSEKANPLDVEFLKKQIDVQLDYYTPFLTPNVAA